MAAGLLAAHAPPGVAVRCGEATVMPVSESSLARCVSAAVTWIWFRLARVLGSASSSPSSCQDVVAIRLYVRAAGCQLLPLLAQLLPPLPLPPLLLLLLQSPPPLLRAWSWCACVGGPGSSTGYIRIIHGKCI